VRDAAMIRRPQPPSEQPLLDELERIGVRLESLWTTRDIKVMPPEAFQIILKHLRSDYPNRTKEGMAAALGRREARDSVWHDFLALYQELPEDTDPDRVKERVAASLSEIARQKDLSTLIDLIRDPSNGPTRVLFVRNLSRSKRPEAMRALQSLRHEKDLRAEIDVALKRKIRRAKGRPDPASTVH
jgi:hypothetical protein